MKNNNSKSELVKYCRAFRNAIEKCDKELLPINFANFPKGSCGDASLLLGVFLDVMGLGKFKQISGTKFIKTELDREWISHAWLQNSEGLIIDITADQFEDIHPKVIVTYISDWHNNFKKENEQPCSFDEYDSHTFEILKNVYKEICKYIHINDVLK
ncbi:MAG: hypothetical protein ACM3O3_06190 [Syntrophothermus sp.]